MIVFTEKDKLDFGKYKDMTVEDVIDEDPGYIQWAVANTALDLSFASKDAKRLIDEAIVNYLNTDETCMGDT